MNTDLEILKNNPKEIPILSPENIIHHLRKKYSNIEFALPDLCILSFFPNLNSIIQQQYSAKSFSIHKEHPYQIFKHYGTTMSFIRLGIGASWACALLEETIALGAKKIVFFGPCGIVQNGIGRGELIVLDSAIRDEGTSFHYQKADRCAYPSTGLMDFLETKLKSIGLLYRKGKTWTTDGLYRETPGKMKRMQEEGCLCVDMEASALFSVARYRKIDIAGIFITQDSIAEGIWNPNPTAAKSPLKPIQLFTTLINILSEFGT